MMIVDAHEDIAWGVQLFGRDVLRSALETRRLEAADPHAADRPLCTLGLPEWLAGGVAVIVGSVFAPLQPKLNARLDDIDPAHAFHVAIEQFEIYRRLADDSDQVRLIERAVDLDEVLASWAGNAPQVGIILSIEGADSILTPAQLDEWYERGVRGVGLAWASGSRYAGGNSAPGPLTDAGRELLDNMAEFGMLLDVSHLSEESFWQAIDRYAGPLAASHSNPRALVPGPRQLSDQMIHAVTERDGVIGIVCYNGFLKPGWTPADGKDAVTLDDVVVAIDHVCQVVGDAAHVGIGSDLDGGFGVDSVPAEIDTVADLARIGILLAARGYTEADVRAVMSENWLRVLREALD